MPGIFRRRRLWTRLALLAAILLLGRFGLGQYIKWNVIRSGQEAVGAKVEIGSSRVSPFAGHIALRNLRVANPQAPMQNLIQADRAEFSLFPEALVFKRVVVREGTIEGLQFGTPRGSSGELAGAKPVDPLPWSAWLDSSDAQIAQNWLAQLEARFQRDLSDQIQSVRLTEDLLARWPQQYAALEVRVRQLHEQTVDFQDRIRQAQANPLRHTQFLKELPDQIAALRTEYDNLHREIASLPDLADADRRAIVAARRHDEELLYDSLQFDKVDDSVLSAYLLHERLAGPVGDLVGWLRWLRDVVPVESQPSQPAHGRGEDVLFAGCDSLPKLQINWLDLQGTAPFAGQTLDFSGRLHGYTSDPAHHNLPLEVHLKSFGTMPLVLDATIDRRGGIAKDELTLECSGMPVPAILLGGSDNLRLSLAPTTASLVVHLVLEGEQLTGDVQFVQQHVQVSPQVAGELKRLPLAATLKDSLRGVESVTTHVTLRGTLEEPKWNISSNLGSALARATGDAFQQAVRQHAKQVVARSQRDVDERLAGLERQIAQQQRALKPQLAASQRLILRIADNQEQDERITYERLGKTLPAGSLFR